MAKSDKSQNAGAASKKEAGAKRPQKKPFMTMGPTLHYKHSNVVRGWWLAVIVYLIACLFWSKVLWGNIDLVSFQQLNSNLDIWLVGHLVKNPVSIYEYPWHIFVLGGLAAVITFLPLMISQLLSFSYSILPVIFCFTVARLPGLAVMLLLACFMVAARPLRFRSRFISLVLCSSPVLLYFIITGKAPDPDPLKWGLSFSPWLLSWLLGLGLCGIILSVGHFTRYRPGQIWIAGAVMLMLSAFIFFDRISFAESDYKLYIQSNSPDSIENFQTHDISSILDKAARNPLFSSDERFAYAPDPHIYREELIYELQEMLSLGTWPFWFIENCDSDFYDYERKRRAVIEQYDYFTAEHPGSSRVASALYYKAILNEYQPDIPAIKELEVLRFYSEFPRAEVYPDWIKLYAKYPESVESLEARWRMAMNLAGRKKFNTAASLCREVLDLADKKREIVEKNRNDETEIFQKPPETVVTPMDLQGLLHRTRYYLRFLKGEYLEAEPALLAKFIRLDKRSMDYLSKLKSIEKRLPDDSPLADNVRLEILQKQYYGLSLVENLKKFVEKFPQADGALEAKYLMGKRYAKLGLEESDPAKKAEFIDQANTLLTTLIEDNPETIFVKDIKKLLSNLPKEE
ncbi:hypothetical protein L21SP3_00254 [Sedimentisphaera cyanobacteriorum]|uniref:Uncharacterized protein n=1 Tax=Sedimentisphaera cyanobacteriorum TaxID=1940790 RepID=A0A1Q2HML3_9BACT|nr:hypothetical protein [Sedimentisphaera cyanobacteriorum]AQQ08473.1 hypothetical protein L21SP3_00254 [Sedimentisphaera cyanobacteriorum]